MNTFNKRVIYGIELSALLLAILLYATYYNIKRSDAMELWVKHSDEVLIHSARIRLMTEESELQARNFMLTNNSNFHRQFLSTSVSAVKELDTLKSLTSDNASIKPYLDSATLYLNKRLAFSRQIISLRNSSGLQGTIAFIRQGQKNMYLNKAAFYIRLIENKENTLMALRKADLKKVLGVMNASLVITFSFIMAAVIMLVIKTRKDLISQNQLLQRMIENDKRMKTAEKLASFGAWSINIDSQVVNGSEGMYHILGFKPPAGDNTFKTLLNNIHPDDKGFIGQILENVTQKQGFSKYTFRLVKNNFTRYIGSGVTVTRDDDYKLISITGYFQDITDKTLAAIKLQEANKELTRLFNKIGDVIFSRDMVKNEFMHISSTSEQLTGYTPDEFIANPDLWLTIIHPDDRDFVEPGKALLARGASIVNQYRITRKDGKTAWVENKTVPTLVNSELIRIDAVIRDITQRRLHEEALEQSEANLRTIFDNTQISYILISDDFNILSFNKPAMLYSEKQNKLKLKKGASVISYFSDARKQGAMDTLKKIKKGGSVCYEYSLPQEDGSISWFEAKWVNVDSIDQTRRGYMLSNIDITEKKTAVTEREKFIADLIQRNKMLEQFTYIISHNLRVPVANIMGLGVLIKMAEPHERQEIIDKLLTTVNNLDHMVMDLNMVLQVRENINENEETVYFREIVDKVVNNLKSLTGNIKIEIESDFSEVGSIFTNYNYLYSIFYNLLLNSVNYRQDNITPVIKVAAVNTGSHLKLVFSDNGKGIDLKKNGADLFGLYRRFDTAVKGKGMGLFMVKTQVEGLGGTISVTSQLNKGTTFSIMLPLRTAQPLQAV